MLKALWADGLRASEIAAELGGVTRNAVIGKVHRLNLDSRVKLGGARADASVRPALATPERRQKPQRAASLAQIFAETPVSVTYDNVVPISQRVLVQDLTDAICHWPIGDPGTEDFYFCGGKALLSLPYCAHHCRIAYQPASDRRHPTGASAGKHGNRGRY